MKKIDLKLNNNLTGSIFQKNSTISVAQINQAKSKLIDAVTKFTLENKGEN